jgi:hypothetical protein
LIGFIIYISNFNRKTDDRIEKELKELKSTVQNLNLTNQVRRGEARRPLL